MEDESRKARDRFLNKCRQHLGVTGLARYTEDYYRLSDRIFQSRNIPAEMLQVLPEFQLCSGICVVEQIVIADAIKRGDLPMEYVVEMIQAGISDRFNLILRDAIREVADEGRLSPQTVAQFQAQEKRLAGNILKATTAPFPKDTPSETNSN